jgi:hypothetical protein
MMNTRKWWGQFRRDPSRQEIEHIAWCLYQNRLGLKKRGGQLEDWVLAEEIAGHSLRRWLFRANQPLVAIRQYCLTSAMADFWRNSSAFESILVFFSFGLTLMYMPIRGRLSQSDNFTDFWVLPAIFIGIAVALAKLTEDGMRILPVLFWSYSRIASGAWLALSFENIFILNDWYLKPDSANWEPLFTANGLSIAGVLVAQSWVERTRKANKDTLR